MSSYKIFDLLLFIIELPLVNLVLDFALAGAAQKIVVEVLLGASGRLFRKFNDFNGLD